MKTSATATAAKFQYAYTYHRKSFFNLHMSWRDVRIDSASSLIYSLSRKIYFSVEKCTRKPNEMEKVFLLSTLPTRFRYHTSVKGQKMNGKNDTGLSNDVEFSWSSTLLFVMSRANCWKSFKLHIKSYARVFIVNAVEASAIKLEVQFFKSDAI